MLEETGRETRRRWIENWYRTDDSQCSTKFARKSRYNLQLLPLLPALKTIIIVVVPLSRMRRGVKPAKRHPTFVSPVNFNWPTTINRVISLFIFFISSLSFFLFSSRRCRGGIIASSLEGRKNRRKRALPRLATICRDRSFRQRRGEYFSDGLWFLLDIGK